MPRAAAEAVADGAHGFQFGFPKKKESSGLAHGPVLDDDFSQDGMIAII
jgi:hypothetical protein